MACSTDGNLVSKFQRRDRDSSADLPITITVFDVIKKMLSLKYVKVSTVLIYESKLFLKLSVTANCNELNSIIL